MRVGGVEDPDDFPVHTPRGEFLQTSSIRSKDEAARSGNELKIALIGHSASGWMCRMFLSDLNYGGRAYKGDQFVRRLVTLGSPHSTKRDSTQQSMQDNKYAEASQDGGGSVAFKYASLNTVSMKIKVPLLYTYNLAWCVY
mgnify:CR=1 FL=1